MIYKLTTNGHTSQEISEMTLHNVKNDQF